MHVPISTCVFTREPTTSASGLAHVGNEDRGGSVYVGYIQTYCWICRYIYITYCFTVLCVSHHLWSIVFFVRMSMCVILNASAKSKSGLLQRQRTTVKMWSPTSCSDHSFIYCVRLPQASVPEVRTVRIYHRPTSFRKSEREIWTRCGVRLAN